MRALPLLLAAASAFANAGGIQPLAPGGDPDSLNRAELLARGAVRSKVDGRRAVTVFAGDVVLPQIVDGRGWRTTIYLHNLEDARKRVEVRFMNKDGSDLTLPVQGAGRVRGVVVTLNAGGSAAIATEGASPDNTEGWAYIVPGDLFDRIGAMAVFRFQAGEAPGFEAVVPAAGTLDQRSRLLFDNRAGYVSAMAIVNPLLTGASRVNVTVRDEAGATIASDDLILPAGNHEAFLLQDRWPATAGKAGSVEFITVGDTYLGVLGLRGSPDGPITSVHSLALPEW